MDALTTIDYVARARDLAPLIAAAGDEIEKLGELPANVRDTLIEQGFFRMLQPRSLGGAELRPSVFSRVTEAIASVDGSTAWVLCQGSGCSMSAAYLAPDQAQEIFGPSTGILAWGPPMGQQARKVPGGYLVSGTWRFASGSHHATWLGAHALISEQDGSPRLDAKGKQVTRTLLFPKSETNLEYIWNVMGLRGTGSDGYTLDELFVPDYHSMSRDDPAERTDQGLLYRFTSGQLYASGFAGVALGLARGMLDAFIEHAKLKKPRGAVRVLRENHVIQSQVAQAEAKWRSSRALLHQTLDTIWEHIEQHGEMTRDHRMELRLASTWAIQQSKEAILSTYEAVGSGGVFASAPFERRVRDILTLVQQGQGRPMHFETCGQYILGLEPESTTYV